MTTKSKMPAKINTAPETLFVFLQLPCPAPLNVKPFFVFTMINDSTMIFVPFSTRSNVYIEPQMSPGSAENPSVGLIAWDLSFENTEAVEIQWKPWYTHSTPLKLTVLYLIIINIVKPLLKKLLCTIYYMPSFDW